MCRDAWVRRNHEANRICHYCLLSCLPCKTTPVDADSPTELCGAIGDMMKTILITIFTAAFLSLNCSTPAEQVLSPLQGTWFNQQQGSFAIPGSTDSIEFYDRLEMTFVPDGHLTITRKILQHPTMEFLGFRFLSEGKYSIYGDQLVLITERRAMNDDTRGLFSETLVPVPISTEVQGVTFSIANGVLTFRYPPCGPNELCITSQSFFQEHN